MNILFTGASSFTGTWLSRELAQRGHHVTATLTREGLDAYQGIARTRLETLRQHLTFAPRCRFGEKQFLDLIRSQPWDLLCHHAADVKDYRSPDFDYYGALANNTRNLGGVLRALTLQGCQKCVVTGTVFEGGEGVGSDPETHISAYGLSKSLTWDIFCYEGLRQGFRVSKFVIPNPFGPFDGPKFPSYLVRTWSQGMTPTVSTPLYVRDNIPVSLLAKSYANFVEGLPSTAGISRRNPSGYVGSQAQFVARFAQEVRSRTSWDCPFVCQQQSFDEPTVRINNDNCFQESPQWDEVGFWDQTVDYYRQQV